MNNPIIIRVCDFTGGPFVVSAEDGQRVPDAIAPVLKEGKPVVLSFAGIETIIAAFLSAAAGQLYGEMVYADVDALLSTRDLNADDRGLFQRVLTNSKRYYENPMAFDQAWAEITGDDKSPQEAMVT
jgi:hypothetical protein